MASPSPMRARSQHSAMEEASSSSVKKTLNFLGSDNEDGNDEELKRKDFCKRSYDASSHSRNSFKETPSRENMRNRLQRIERMDVYGRKNLPYLRHGFMSPDKIQQQRRSTSELRTPKSHKRIEPARRVHTIRWLGAGASAEVFEVCDPISGALFAVKKSKQALRNDRERDLLAQEIIILDNLTSSRHNFDNIVRYYQAWQEYEFFFLQMELCEGGTLQDFITLRHREILPESYLWKILRDVASGLNILSEHGIVHLDIKPDNIFVTCDGLLKIGDFGMAGKVIETTKTTSKVGFLEGDAKYIAKELLSSADRLPSADIFCLGIMMLEIAAGITLPEAGKGWHDLRNGFLPKLSHVYSESVNVMIQMMMHPDPTKRPSAAEILQNSCVRTATEPVTLLKEHALKQKLIAPTGLQSNTNRSARKGLLTPHKTRRKLA